MPLPPLTPPLRAGQSLAEANDDDDDESKHSKRNLVARPSGCFLPARLERGQTSASAAGQQRQRRAPTESARLPGRGKAKNLDQPLALHNLAATRADGSETQLAAAGAGGAANWLRLRASAPRSSRQPPAASSQQPATAAVEPATLHWQPVEANLAGGRMNEWSNGSTDGDQRVVGEPRAACSALPALPASHHYVKSYCSLLPGGAASSSCAAQSTAASRVGRETQSSGRAKASFLLPHAKGMGSEFLPGGQRKRR